MAAVLKWIFQAIACFAGFIGIVAIVIAIHKRSEQEALMPRSNASTQNDQEIVSYDPRRQLEAGIVEARMSGVRSCLRQVEAAMLYQGIRNRKELIEKSSAMCRNSATTGLSPEGQSALLASLEPWAEYELEIILKYGTSHIRVETISPSLP